VTVTCRPPLYDWMYRLGHLGFQCYGRNVLNKNYPNGMRLCVMTDPDYWYNFWVLYDSRGQQIFCKACPREL
jgi:hypothetical protein